MEGTLTKQQRKALKAHFATIEEQTLYTIAAMTMLRRGDLASNEDTAQERTAGCTAVLAAMVEVRKTLNIPLPPPCTNEPQ